MFNLILTKTSFDGTHSIKRKYKYIIDENNKIVGGFTKKYICDLNGNIIAKKYQKGEIKTKANNKSTVLFYNGACGKIKVSESKVFLENEIIGTVENRERNVPHIILASMATVMLLMTLVFVSMIKLPYDEVPNIVVEDYEGSWAAEGMIGVLDSKINPGSMGRYDFILENPHNINLNYSFSIVEVYNGEIVKNFPLEFRIKMNNMLLGNGEWLSAEDLSFEELYILPSSSQIFTLEWRWPFEGNNELDTILGQDNGNYQLVFKLVAESVEE